MRVLIISDTHSRNENLLEVVKKAGKIDLCIHCGDAEGNEEELRQMLPCPMQIVLGNNDFFSDLPRELEITLGKYNVWITHGHNYLASIGNERIKQEAIARRKDIVIFGHSHRPGIDITEEIMAINPGSLSYPRQDGKRPSYCIMEIDSLNKVDFEIHYL